MVRCSCGELLLGLTGHVETLDEGVSNLTRSATTEWAVGQDVAFGVDTAHTWARIDTSLIDTRAIHRTFCVNDTLGSAVGRSSLISGQARTAGFSVYITASAIWTTR